MLIIELSDGEGAAAWAGRVLAWAGGEVVKVESPERVEADRALDLYLNAGKGRMALDYRDPSDRVTIDAMVAEADIVITDAPAADVVDYALLSPGPGACVKVSITPYGLDGPCRDWKATSPTLLAHGGYTDLMGDPGRAPLTMPGDYPFYQAGSVAAFAALAAGWRGTAAAVSISVLECLAGAHQFTDVLWTAHDLVRSRHGNRFEGVYPIGLYPCQDGWYSLCVLEQMWFRFAWMLERPDLAEDHELSTNAGRIIDPDTVDKVLSDVFGGWTKKRIFQEAQEAWRVAAGHLMSLDEVLEDRHLEERGFWVQVPGEPSVWSPGRPFRFHGSHVAPLAASAPVTSSSSLADRPLEGLRVLELTDYWAGPLAGRTLGDLGADVILIERASHVPPRTALFDKLNRNKRSIALDLKSEEGRAVFLELVARSDVVLENFSARIMPSLGLGYEVLRAANESIVYLSISGYGTSGPYAEYVATGPSAEPMTGMTALMGYSAAEPRVTSKGILDPMAGNLALDAVLAALHRRNATGEGGFVEVSLHECGIVFVGDRFLDWQLTGRAPGYGNAHPRFAPWGVYRCSGDDDWIAITVGNEDEWNALCAYASAGWELDERFRSMEWRCRHRPALDAVLDGWARGYGKGELASALQDRGVPAAPVLRVSEWMEDETLQEASYFSTLPGRDGRPLRSDGLCLRIDGIRDYTGWRPAPAPGQHTSEILAGVLGMDAGAVERLVASGAAAAVPA